MMNFQYNGYQPYYQPPVQDHLAQLRTAQAPATPPTQNGILWCIGEDGARSYMVAPGCNALLLDSEGDHFYIKSVDASGMPLPLRTFDYVERTAPKPTAQAEKDYVTREEFDALLKRLEKGKDDE